MARFVLDGAGRYVDPNNPANVLIDSYKQTGSGEYVNQQGRVLNAAPTGPAPVAPQTLRDKVFAAAQKAQEDYQAAVKSQMDQVFEGYKARRDAAAASLKQLGNTNVADVNQRYDTMLGQVRSRANASGMGGTTALAGQEAMIERERQAALARARGQRAGMEIDTMSQLEGDRIRSIENMNIAPPDMSTMLELARMEGQATQDQLQPAAWGGGGGGYGGMMAPAMIGGSAYGGFASNGFNIPGAAMGVGGGFLGASGGGGGRGKSPMQLASYQAQRQGYKSTGDWLTAGGFNAPNMSPTGQMSPQQRTAMQRSAPAVDPLTRNMQQQAVTNSARRATLAKMGVRNVQDVDAAVAAQKYKMTHTPNQIAPNQQVPSFDPYQSTLLGNRPMSSAVNASGGNPVLPISFAPVGPTYSTPVEAARIAGSRLPTGGALPNTPVYLYRPDPNATPAVGFGTARPGQMPAYDNWEYVPPPAAPTMPMPFDPRDFAQHPYTPPTQTSRYPTYAELMDALRQVQGGGY